jgi:predicted methyltransferase
MNPTIPARTLKSVISLSCFAATALLAACANMGAAQPTLSKERIHEIVSSPDRTEADRTNDIRRKPEDMLAFIGVKPGMVALDIASGGGYTTELIARAVGPTGRVYGQSQPRDPAKPPPAPAAPEGQSAPAAKPVAPPTPAPAAAPMTSAQRLAVRSKNPAAGNMIAVAQKFDNPVPAEVASNGLDLVTLMFNYHDLGFLGVGREQMNRAVFAALKPGGIYIVADHSGRPGTGISESGTLHRVEEAFVIKEVEEAGFKLAERGDFLRNPSDPRDKNTPEPPMPKDEFVLKFVKP